ncbi:MAG TPA: helix-turn-helix domain-containing protein [Candidatus Acidoferrum sp.]|nr:helix-turn-helix domain-containing protein [Candidatus Acidoferrum sp.]
MLRKKPNTPPVVASTIDPEKRWFTTEQAAQYLSVSVSTIRAVLHRGEIKAARLQPRAGGYHIDRNDLDSWLERRKRIVPPYRAGSRPWVRDVKPWRKRRDRRRKGALSHG